MMQNLGLKDLSHMQSRRNVLKYLVRVEMASDWFTKIYRSIFAEQNFLQNRDMACKLGCGLFLSPQLASSVACKMFISTTFGDLLAIAIIRSKFGENESLK